MIPLFFLVTTLCLYSPSLIADTDIGHFFDMSISSHVLHLPNKPPLEYSAFAGRFPILNNTNQPIMDLFFIAYIEDTQENKPITFVFPGGPGGSCGGEVLCTIGPKRLLTPQEGKALLPPYKIIDNQETLLPWTDLIFVDPVLSGLSRFTENATNEDLSWALSVDGDIQILSRFIKIFLSYFERWNSPKYLSGTSYGTVRSAGIAEQLLCSDISVNGLILLGSALDLTLLQTQENNPLSDCLLIPTFAATAWYHKRLWPEKSISEVVEYARRFAYEIYAPVMLQPTRLNFYEQQGFYRQLAELIGLPADTVHRYTGRFDQFLYTTEFMGYERKVIGMLDTRYIGDLTTTQRQYYEDPSYQDMQGVFCAFNDYLQKDLGVDAPLKTYISSNGVIKFWDFSTYDSSSAPDLMQRIRRSLVYNPSMRVFAGSGYYDCRTPFTATEYAFEHLNLPPSYKKNCTFEYYEAGHGFVFDLNCLKKLHKDLIKFYTQ